MKFYKLDCTTGLLIEFKPSLKGALKNLRKNNLIWKSGSYFGTKKAFGKNGYQLIYS